MGLIETTRGLLPGAGKMERGHINNLALSTLVKRQNSCERLTLRCFVLQGAVSGCRGWLASLWPRSSSSQVVEQKFWHVATGTGCLLVSECVVYDWRSICLLSGKRVEGQRALEMGLVNRAVEQNQTGDAAYREALNLAREILPQVRIQPQLRSFQHHPCNEVMSY